MRWRRRWLRRQRWLLLLLLLLEVALLNGRDLRLRLRQLGLLRQYLRIGGPRDRAWGPRGRREEHASRHRQWGHAWGQRSWGQRLEPRGWRLAWRRQLQSWRCKGGHAGRGAGWGLPSRRCRRQRHARQHRGHTARRCRGGRAGKSRGQAGGRRCLRERRRGQRSSPSRSWGEAAFPAGRGGSGAFATWRGQRWGRGGEARGRAHALRCRRGQSPRHARALGGVAGGHARRQWGGRRGRGASGRHPGQRGGASHGRGRGIPRW